MAITPELVKSLAKKYGEDGQLLVGSYSPELHKVSALSTGSLIVDRLTGIGGFPKGRLTEIFGRPASGKTSICFSAMAECQKQGKAVLYVDAELAFSGEWAKAMGVDLSADKFLLVSTNEGDRAFDIAVEALGTGEFGLVVFDSVPALRPRKELEGTMEDNFIAGHPRMMNRGVALLQLPTVTSNAAVVFINQVRDSMNPYGSPTTTPGGWSFKHAMSLRLEVTRAGDIKDGNELVGFEMKAKLVKNKVGNLSRETPAVRCYTSNGFSKEHDLLVVAIEEDIISKRGAWIAYKTNKWQGEESAVAALRKDPQLFNEIMKDIEESKNDQLPPLEDLLVSE